MRVCPAIDFSHCEKKLEVTLENNTRVETHF
jgi:hypothetical protein